ncbi:type II toxin-antitoxin system RelE/ParE family toxin [Flavobacterium litorale]|uniref:Type II toxin-antitoxin system RelE/ParE family toxin n=1 Tax=Flavobacterium litorale TaxID=2856519 RepID=A0ABX8V864_9FLAO|nr:type II toxin-antitoxin system RelE/ParE family toxin [Flavobacterium litorale]QYJ69044.1 type II toxin-antitoxin system RelE/ParE family toxin [Flavobacterium litorale]
MGFKVVWSDFAKSELDKIFEYYCENASTNFAKKIVQKIISEPDRLINNPEISQREELLLNREIDYFSLLCDNYKIIYSVDKKLQLIKIADVFDTRQNPIKLKRNK